MIKHILVTRKRSDTQDYIRCDHYDGKWAQFNNNGQVLHAVLNSVKSEIDSHGGNIAVTMSSCRPGECFVNPETVGIGEGISTMVLMPLEAATGDSIQDSMRLWRSFVWSGPGMTPIPGDKVRQKSLSKWLLDFFSIPQLESWRAVRNGGRVEIWIRPHWVASDVIGRPAEPDKEKAAIAPVTEDAQDDEAPEFEYLPIPIKDGKPVVKLSFNHKTGWRYHNLSGEIEETGFKTKDAAQKAMELYMKNNKLFLSEPIC